MKTGNRIEMVKHALRLLLAELDGNDTVAIVAFSNEARLVLPATPAAQRGLIESAIHPLAPNGGTNAEAGLLMGYEAALVGLRANANNRVVFLSDGVANVGQTDQDRITAEVARHRKEGVYLNTIGVGMSNHNDVLLEQLANTGDGICNYIDSPAEARRALVENFTGQFEPIARDVKVQVEFDPQQVHRWRLLGYENRAIDDRDFRNDAVDAGELGAGHQVVALYEVERTLAAVDAPLATVRLRWKRPYEAGMGQTALAAGEEASEIEQPVFTRGTSWEGTSAGYKRAVLVAQFAEILRRSSHARGDSLDALLRDLEPLARDGDADLRELFDLVRQSRELIVRSLPACDELCLTIDEIRRWNLRQAELELLRVERDQEELEDLARRNAELEQRIRDLVRRKYEPR
jgi:Ca-activated chloride channel family protein